MTISDTTVLTSKVTKRGRKPKTSSQQLLTEALKHLTLAQERHKKALVRVEHERMAESAQTGRRIYLAAIEKLHPGERALLINPLLDILTGDDRTSIQTWLDSLTQVVA